MLGLLAQEVTHVPVVYDNTWQTVMLAIIGVLNVAVIGWFSLRRVQETNDVKRLTRDNADLHCQVDALKVDNHSLHKELTEVQKQNRVLRSSNKAMVRLLGTYKKAAEECYVETDEYGIVRVWDTAATLTFGWTAEEAIGNDLSSLIVPPDFRQAHRDISARVMHAHRKPRCDPILAKATCKMGVMFDVEIRLIPPWENIKPSDSQSDSGSWRYAARITKLVLPSKDTVVKLAEHPSDTDDALPIVDPSPNPKKK